MKRAVSLLPWAGMGILAFTLPFTSFPLVARLTGSTMVAPLSLLPMGAMLLLWLLPYFARRGALPPQSRVLAAFVLVALLSCIAAFALVVPANQNHSVFRREIEAIATLAIGVGFYLVVAAWLNTSERLRFFLRWLNWGGVLMLAWSFLQAALWYRFGGYPDWLWVWQGQITTSDTLFPARVNGLAYEPSWLAHQLNMIYLSYWLAAAFTGFTAGFTARHSSVWKIHFEHILLVLGLAVLFLSVSRVGWLAFLLMLAFLLLLLNLRFVRWAQQRLLSRYSASHRFEPFIRRWFVLASLLVLFAIYAALLVGAAYLMTRIDPRMARLFDFSLIREHDFVYYANQLVFAERIVFWEAGWEIFNDFPILGVGLGNAGFFFSDNLSAFSWALTEVRLLAYQWTSLPNIKSLWVRLLAETGIVGFAFFASWLYVLWKSGRFLMKQSSPLFRMAGLTGALALVGFLIEGFSVDTFALPYFWISFGILTAGCEQARRKWAE